MNIRDKLAQMQQSEARNKTANDNSERRERP